MHIAAQQCVASAITFNGQYSELEIWGLTYFTQAEICYNNLTYDGCAVIAVLIMQDSYRYMQIYVQLHTCGKMATLKLFVGTPDKGTSHSGTARIFVCPALSCSMSAGERRSLSGAFPLSKHPRGTRSSWRRSSDAQNRSSQPLMQSTRQASRT